MLVAVMFFCVSFVDGQILNECSLKNGSSGVCELIPECPQEIPNEIYPPQCTFENTHTIVCCSQKPTVKPQPSITALHEVKSRSPGFISNRKCMEYSKYVWNVKEEKDECPFNRAKRAVGGVPTSRREFPHMVQIGYDGTDGLIWSCGGSLISPRYVVTAAHCLSSPSIGDAKYARMGIVDLDDNDNKQQYNIAEIIPHPQYKKTSVYHNIGLIKLESEAKLNPWVRPACLYTNNSFTPSNLIATGWGKTDFAGVGSRVLLKVILELYDQPKCNATYKRDVGSKRLQDGIKDELMICAGHSTELKDTCQGDSGGPLQVYRNGQNELLCMYDVVGITAFGKACGLAVNVPSVFTRVSHYIKWIEDIVWPLT